MNHLPYLRPFNFVALLAHYRTYRVGELEQFDGQGMRRLVEIDGRTGWIEITDDADHARLNVRVGDALENHAPEILARVRAMFDLDADPARVGDVLGVTKELTALLEKHPGLRVPSGWDAFEMAIGTILGQLISVERARALTADLIELLGKESGECIDGRPIKLFPRAIDVAESDLTGLGTTGARKHSLREFSRRIASGELSLDPDQDAAKFTDDLLAIRGVGPWTATYIAMKVRRDRDAFPETDLILTRAFDLHPRADFERAKPFRAYAAILLWQEYAQSLKKPRGDKRAAK